MKKLLLSAIVGTMALSAMADDYKYLVVYAADGTATDIELAQLSKITFTQNNMVVATAEGEQSFALSALGKMVFASQPTPVETLAAATEGRLTFQGGSIAVGAEAKGQTLAVYAQNGALVAQQKVGEAGASLNLAALPKGVYVVRVGQTAVKVVK